MIKKVVISFFVFLAGVMLAIFTESELRQLIQNLFRYLTGYRIHFNGKNFHLFAPTYYYISIGLFVGILFMTKFNLTTRQAVRLILIEILTFFSKLTIICLISSNLLLIECTACGDGTRGIHYNEISYSFIVLSSFGISILPSVIMKIKRALKETPMKDRPTLSDHLL